MAVYKVPQNVEADDKLLGPFSFRQFIYLIIVALAIAGAWGLAQLFIGLAVIPIPIILLFGILALPLRKDQPMEVYLAAIISFYLKPRKRLWDPDGTESYIEVVAPKTEAPQLTKTIYGAEADQRFSYLANLVDSGGWAIRGINGTPDSSMNSDLYFEAQQTEDVLDKGNDVAQSFDKLMQQSTQKHQQEVREHMLHPTPAPKPAAEPAPTTAPNATFTIPTPQAAADDQNVQFNPYPTFQQSVVQPLNDPSHQYQGGAQPQAAPPAATPLAAPQPPEPIYHPQAVPEPAPSTSDSGPSPDIMSLANNTDLSVETLAREAERIHKKAEAKDLDDEVVISLR